jgi:hypothetical protein
MNQQKIFRDDDRSQILSTFSIRSSRSRATDQLAIVSTIFVRVQKGTEIKHIKASCSEFRKQANTTTLLTKRI